MGIPQQPHMVQLFHPLCHSERGQLAVEELSGEAVGLGLSELAGGAVAREAARLVDFSAVLCGDQGQLVGGPLPDRLPVVRTNSLPRIEAQS